MRALSCERGPSQSVKLQASWEIDNLKENQKSIVLVIPVGGEHSFQIENQAK